jgi:hypothetical protein
MPETIYNFTAYRVKLGQSQGISRGSQPQNRQPHYWLNAESPGTTDSLAQFAWEEGLASDRQENEACALSIGKCFSKLLKIDGEPFNSLSSTGAACSIIIPM